MNLFSPYTLPEVLIFLLKGLRMTLFIAGISIGLSFVFGAILGIGRQMGKGIFHKICALYIECVRNMPLLLYILAFRFTMPTYIGNYKIQNKPVASAILAMTVFTSAMVAEIIRGGLNSIPKGQWEAAASQGFTRSQTLIHIILPQAVRNILVPMVGQFVTCIKDTSFCAVVGIGELMMNTTIIMGKFKFADQVIVLYAITAFIYYLINILLMHISQRLFKKPC
jgi:putative glutamine transport system permease protein